MKCSSCEHILEGISKTKYYIRVGNEKWEVCPMCYARIKQKISNYSRELDSVITDIKEYEENKNSE